ncbi:hypothetical protein ACX80S_06680 [Arthrobacter sp. RHLT1-20]
MTAPAISAESTLRPGGTAAGAIELRQVSKSYGDVVAVDQLDLTIQPGEFVTLLGPSGSGERPP